MSGGIHVDYADVTKAAGGLDDAANTLDGTASSAPSGVDAGDATYVVSNFLADLTTSVGELVRGLRAAARGARDNLDDHREADARSRDTLTHPGLVR